MRLIRRSHEGPVTITGSGGPRLFVRADRCDLTKPLSIFGPKIPDHPTIGEVCPGCQEPLAAGDVTVLIAIGPGARAESRERARAGRYYSAVAVEVHLTCATGARLEGEELR